MRVLKAGYVEVEPTIRMGETLRLEVPQLDTTDFPEAGMSLIECAADPTFRANDIRNTIAYAEEVVLADWDGRIKLSFNRDGCLLSVKLTGFRTPVATYAPEVIEPEAPYIQWAMEVRDRDGAPRSMEMIP